MGHRVDPTELRQVLAPVHPQPDDGPIAEELDSDVDVFGRVCERFVDHAEAFAQPAQVMRPVRDADARRPQQAGVPRLHPQVQDLLAELERLLDGALRAADRSVPVEQAREEAGIVRVRREGSSSLLAASWW